MNERYAPPADLDAVLAEIRKTSLEWLADAEYLENRILPSLGFHRHPLNHYPVQLQKFCGIGIHSMQLPNQFSKYLAFISKQKINSYMEIGVSWGGTFIITVEYLKRFNGSVHAIAVDLVGPEPNIINYLEKNGNCDYLEVDSKSKKFKDFIENRSYDLTLIDGDHSEDGCWQDFELLKDHSKIIAFHDIANDLTPGVKNVWKRLRRTYTDSNCHEFIDQYPEVKLRESYSFMGLGAVIVG